MVFSLHSFLKSATSTSGGSTAIALLLIVGAIEGVKALVRFASGIYIYYLRPGKNLKKLGQWAVVTGATDGIGRAYADGLAKKGMQMLLKLRNTLLPEQSFAHEEIISFPCHIVETNFLC